MLSGKYRIRFSEYDREIGPGDSYSIPADVLHSIEIIDAGEVLDFLLRQEKIIYETYKQDKCTLVFSFQQFRRVGINNSATLNLSSRIC